MSTSAYGRIDTVQSLLDMSGDLTDRMARDLNRMRSAGISLSMRAALVRRIAEDAATLRMWTDAIEREEQAGRLS